MDQKRIFAVILSLFVFPGCGHFYLGRRRAGYGLSLIFFGGFFLLIVFYDWDFFERMRQMSEAGLGVSSLMVVARETWLAHQTLYLTGLILLGLLWIGAVLDLTRKRNGATIC